MTRGLRAPDESHVAGAGDDLRRDRLGTSPLPHAGFGSGPGAELILESYRFPRHSLDPCVCICNYIDVYEIEFAPSVAKDLSEVRPFDRARIMNAIEELLTHEPTVPTRHRKLLPDLEPPFEVIPPIWELRVGEFRVFYGCGRRGEKSVRACGAPQAAA